jgi:hypothetical protein
MTLLTERSARRSTPSIMSRSAAWKTPVRVPSAMRLFTSSSVTVLSGFSGIRSSLISASVEIPSSHTTGAPAVASPAMNGATAAAMRSGSFMATRLGTSSPMISEK